ncbi:MAG TPA: SOS response-associated peptidase [Gammaproteobacteria bacterium]|nr:SOS response-associated peptidase [Gammaproteobacteria bacterium]
MCGRFALLAPSEEIVKHFRLKRGFSMTARYNIAPTQIIPIIRSPGEQVDFVRWGLIASWTKQQEKIPSGVINARLETIAQKPTFRLPFAKQRCIVPASGYYEWKTVKDRKQPFYVTLPSKSLMGFAGLWDRWMTPEGDMLESCALLTTESQGEWARIHDRMPLLLSESQYDIWLDASFSPIRLQEIIGEPIEWSLKIFPVTSRVNNPRFDAKECIQTL